MSSNIANNAILLTVCTNTYFRSQFDIASALKRGVEYADKADIWFYFPREYPQLREHINRALALGGRVLLGAEFSWSLKAIASVEAIEEIDPSVQGFRYAHRIPVIPRVVFKIACAAVSFARAVTTSKTKKVVLPAENRYEQNTFTRVARLMKVDSFVMPSWVEGPNELLKSGQASQIRRGSLSEWFAKCLAPENLHYPAHQQDSVWLRYSNAEAVVRKLLGVLPPLPWELHSGFAGQILFESLAHLEIAKSQGLSVWNARVVGSIPLDLIASKREELSQTKTEKSRQSSQSDEVRILIAVPPDMTGSRLKGRSYHSVIRSLAVALEKCSSSRPVAVLHPTTSQSEIPPDVRTRWAISDRAIEEEIPSCDLFVASVSSTIAWALAANKIVVNWDVYGYEYQQYVNERSVLPCETDEELKAAVSEGLRRCVLADEISRTALSGSRWGPMDGLSWARIQRALDWE